MVHTHLYRSQVYARPAARLAGTPVVLTTERSIGATHIERRKARNRRRVEFLTNIGLMGGRVMLLRRRPLEG